MKSRLITSTALAAAILALAGCWEDDDDMLVEDTSATVGVDGVPTPDAPLDAAGTESLNTAATTDEIARQRGEQAVEAAQEDAEIVSEDAAVRDAENEGIEITDEMPDSGEAPINQMADEDIPPVNELNLDDPVVDPEVVEEVTDEENTTDIAGGTVAENETVADADLLVVDTPAAAGTADQVNEVTSEAAEAEAQTDTGEASQEATNAAVEAATDGESPAIAARDDAAAAATEEGTVGSAEAKLDEALTVEGFDLSTVRLAIEDSSLDLMEKTTLITGLESAAENPAILDNYLNQVRAVLDVE